MTASNILAIDAGTTGVTALVVTAEGTIAAKGYQEFAQHFPQPGWVEHSPEEIWQATLEATRACLKAWSGTAADLAGIGSEGSTRHAWLRANAPAYGWQHPSWARIGGSRPESWHWEFVGTGS